MYSRHVMRIETDYYIAHLHAALVVWIDTMTMLQHVAVQTLTREDTRTMIALLALAHHDLAQRSVAPAMLSVHRAAQDLLLSGMDTLAAIAAGRGRSAMRDLSEQLTIFQTELVLSAARAGI